MAGTACGLADDDEAGHAEAAASLDVRFEVDPDGNERVRLEGRDVTRDLRTERAGAAASRVAAMPSVRTALLGRQRAFAEAPGLVADGRDMGTVVFASAPVKVYLTASAEERALRRYKQLKEKGLAANLADLSQEILQRDRRDSTRPVAPLRPAPGAVVIDSTGIPVEEVVDRVLALARMQIPAIL
jgi:cytidylate kinase